MLNGFIQIFHYSCGEDIIRIFCAPVLICCRNRAIHQFLCHFVTANFYFLFLQSLAYCRQEGFRNFFMNQQTFTGITYTGTLGFRIDHDFCRFFKVCTFIHINMAVAHTSLDDRNGTVLYHTIDQACAAAGNQNIQITIQAHHFICCFSGSIGHHLYRIFRQTFCHQCRTDGIDNCMICLESLFTAS